MKAIIASYTDSIEKLSYVEAPEPLLKPNEVKVKTLAAGVNFFDLSSRKSFIDPAGGYIPGHEGSGFITAIGEGVTRLKVSDSVAFVESISGSYAEYAIIQQDQAVLLPENIDLITAAACLLQGLTAHYLTHDTFQLQKGHTVLVHAAAGGVGSLIVQMAKYLGCKVIAMVSTPEKKTLVEQFGADNVILYEKNSFASIVHELTDRQGVDVVYDSIGAATFVQSIKSLKKRGLLVSYGQASGPISPFDIQRLAKMGSLYITSPTLNDYIHAPDELNTRAKKLFEYIIRDEIKIHIGQKYALQDAALAHENLRNRLTVGKSILLPEFC